MMNLNKSDTVHLLFHVWFSLPHSFLKFLMSHDIYYKHLPRIILQHGIWGISGLREWGYSKPRSTFSLHTVLAAESYATLGSSRECDSR